MDPRWSTVLTEARALHATLPALSAFCPFPNAPGPQDISAKHDPLAGAMAAAPGDTTPTMAPLRDALIAAAPLGQWRDTYRDTPIGAELHAHFGTYEVLGRDAPFAADAMRGFVIYQAPGYHYPMHHHPAEELYLVLSGQAEFHIDGQGSTILRPGDTAYHDSNQPHALTTHGSPVIAYVLWRGDLSTKPVFTYPEALT